MDIQTMVFKIFLRARDRRRSLLYPSSQHACAYRSHDGLACFVGVLIPDDRYSPDFEGQNVGYLLQETDALDVKAEQYAAVFALLTEAQRIHDCFPPEDWELLLQQSFLEIVKAHNLDILLPEDA